MILNDAGRRILLGSELSPLTRAQLIYWGGAPAIVLLALSLAVVYLHQHLRNGMVRKHLFAGLFLKRYLMENTDSVTQGQNPPQEHQWAPADSLAKTDTQPEIN